MRVLLVLLSTAAVALAQSCPPEDTVYFEDPQQCDKYIQCKDGIAEELLCPDGLLFSEYVSQRGYPCVYPTEVDCGARTRLQSAQPTQHCRNSYGYFNSGDRSQCGHFWNCVEGREFKITCPEGLAFSSVTYTCEWADASPDCDAAEYLGFQCPANPDEAQLRLIGTPRYASPRDCRKFFLCVGVSPRLQTCVLGTVFNGETLSCDEPELVRGCETYYPPEQLAEIRARKEEARLRAEQRSIDYNKRVAALARQ